MTNEILQSEAKTPALKGWTAMKYRDPVERLDGNAVWVKRVQLQGLTPSALETYLKSGWTVGAIANDRHLDSVDVAKAIERWL
ncbi:MAG: hypothetical protein RLZZ627_13 [Pseudomonadota bacterium]|jgi:hypothetical protein